MNEEFRDTSTILRAFAVSVYVLGYSVRFRILPCLTITLTDTIQIGPLVFSPLSEIFGRRVVLGVTKVNFALWQIGCALSPDISSLIIFRFLTGVGGSGCLAIGSGVIADLFEKEERGVASTFYSIGPLFGPVLGTFLSDNPFLAKCLCSSLHGSNDG